MPSRLVPSPYGDVEVRCAPGLYEGGGAEGSAAETSTYAQPRADAAPWMCAFIASRRDASAATSAGVSTLSAAPGTSAQLTVRAVPVRAASAAAAATFAR